MCHGGNPTCWRTSRLPLGARGRFEVDPMLPASAAQLVTLWAEGWITPLLLSSIALQSTLKCSEGTGDLIYPAYARQTAPRSLLTSGILLRLDIRDPRGPRKQSITKLSAVCPKVPPAFAASSIWSLTGRVRKNPKSLCSWCHTKYLFHG